MARRTKQEAEKTRARILANALSLFVKKGYEHTTFNDIAARLKMTKGAVYWHFESKQALLMAIIDEMLEKFRWQIVELLPEGENSFKGLSFPVVADMMVRHAVQTVGDSKMSAFFLLVHEQIRWSSTSMVQIREDLLKNSRFGPWEAFRVAVENGMRIGTIHNHVNAIEVASSCMALWNGLVRSRIAGFLQCDLENTLKNAYSSIWRSIAKRGG
jgi:TetR/AcrR family acrAB operon transcriptional repressor